MAVYLQQGRLARVLWTSPDAETAARSTAAQITVTASLYLPSGKLAGALTTAMVGVSRAFNSGATPDVADTDGALQVWGAGGLAAEYFAIGGTSVSRVRVVKYLGGSEYLLDTPAPFAQAGDEGELRPASYTVDIPASLLGFVGTHARIEWVVANAATGETRAYQQAVHVGRTLFSPAMSAGRAREYAGSAFPHATGNRPDGWFALLAARSAERVERRVLASGRFPNLFGDADLFADAGLVSLRLELGFEGLVPAGFDPQGYQQQQEEELTRQIEYATAQQWHDADADGVPDADEFRALFSIPMRLG